MGNHGGCLFALHQYQSALSQFLEARRLAQAAGDSSEIAVLDANIASLYSEMGELDAAVHWLEESRGRLSERDRSHLPKLLIQMGVLRARQGRMAESLASFGQGIAGAEAAGDRDLYALGWNRMGEALLLAGDLAGAEPALLEAYRVRKLHHLALDTSYRSLGRLRLAQGDLNSAGSLLDRAVELARHPQGLAPTWDIYHSRGRVRLAQGRLTEALDDLRAAVRLARAWRWSAPAADAARVGAESMLDQVYSALIDAANRLHERTHDPGLIRETFEAAEENRSASLRAMLSRNGAPPDLPPAYWEALTRFERASIAGLRNPTGETQDGAAAARAEIVRVEAAALPSIPADAEGLLARTRAALPPDTALFSFQLSENGSWLWAVDEGGVLVFALPPRSVLETLASAFRLEIAGPGSGSPAPRQAGRRLYDALFGQVPPRFTGRRRWILALDKGLLDVPFPALPGSVEARPPYLIERHVVQIVPGATLWAEAAGRVGTRPDPEIFLGIGDPIFNSADPRLVASAAGSHSGISLFPALFAAPPAAWNVLELPRLVASAAELDACARAWHGEAVLLKGAAASRRGLIEQLRRNPAVIHFATHFLVSPDDYSGGMIALTASPRGETEILTPLEIAHWRIANALVTLSGCQSAAGQVLPGAGLMGLTRAWLMAGAGAVVASRWPVPDESGDLFTALYRHLPQAASSGPAGALAAAQVDMIRSGSWRANPRYWGAFFVVADE
jgi:CHAT domain-containing protein/tetratricopeptide (TPR) repeat protein